MKNLNLTTVGGMSALVAVAGFAVGVALMAAGGVETLIPETGEQGLDWLADVRMGGTFSAGAWLGVFAGLFLLVALVCFYDALREAGPVMIVAPIAGAIGMTLVTISHVLPIAIAAELAPEYSAASGAAQHSLAATFDTLASLALGTNYVGNALNWGVAVPLYALAVLRTRAVPRWIGWLGLVVAVLGGWLGLLAPVSGAVVESVSSIGFVGFFVFVASMGIALLRLRPRREPAAAPRTVTG